MLKKFRSTTLLVTALLLSLFSTNILPVATAYATTSSTDPNKEIICHATNSQTNPYTVNEVDKSSIDEANNQYLNGHGDHTGPVWHTGIADHSWGDIIPPFTNSAGHSYAGYNWTPEGQAVYNNGTCDGIYAPTTDVCPNIPGDQATIPTGMVKDNQGNCVTPPPAVNLCETNFFPAQQMWEITWGQQFSDTNGAPTFTAQSNGGLVTINGNPTTWTDYHLYVTVAQVQSGRTVTYGFADGTVRTAVVSADANSCPSVVWTTSTPQVPVVKPCVVTTSQLITKVSDFADSQDTRSAGHYSFTANGLYINTDDNSSNAKVAWYHNVDYSLSDVGEPSIVYTTSYGTIKPGMQISLDKDGNGTVDGILVGEPDAYGNNWWSNANFGISSGMGYASYGTLNDYLAANPHAIVKAVGFSLGSGVFAGGVLKSLTFGCNTFTFGVKPDSASVTLCHATGSKNKPFVKITVDASGAYDGHYGNSHQDGRDIIPPFDYNGMTYSQNAGQTIYNNDCEVPRTPMVCTVSDNNYLMPWTFDGTTYPETGAYPSGVAGSYTFKNTGLYLSTPNEESYVDGLIDAGQTPLIDISNMSYKTLREASSTGASNIDPAYILYVDKDGDMTTTGDRGYLIFEPVYNGTVETGVWQTWDVIDGGNAVFTGFGDGNPNKTWNSILADYPDAVAIAYGFNQGTSNKGTNSAVQDLEFDCAVTHFGAVGGLGGVPETPPTPGQVLGTSTTTTPGKTLGTSTALPATIPATGGSSSNALFIVATSILAYGAAYFLQGRRQIADKLEV